MAGIRFFPTTDDRERIHEAVMSRSRMGGMSHLDLCFTVGAVLRAYGVHRLAVRNYWVIDCGDIGEAVEHPWIVIYPRVESKDSTCPVCGGQPEGIDGWMFGDGKVTMACQNGHVYNWRVADQSGL